MKNTDTKARLIDKIKADWSSWLVVAAILTAGTNYGTTITRQNYQLQELEKSIEELNEDIIDLKIQLQEQEITRLYEYAESILVSVDSPEELYKYPTGKTVIKRACANSIVKKQLLEWFDQKVNTFCNYVKR